jgi:putative PIN family toxin of toxin-antitoxin system
MPVRAVIDTNVLVSALLTTSGKPARVVDLALTGQIVACYDARILTEYAEVLSRPRFPFHPAEVSALLSQLRAIGLPVIGGSQVSLPDPDDVPFAEVAQWARAWFVTGNLRHYPSLTQAVSPADFLAALKTGNAGLPSVNGSATEG